MPIKTKLWENDTPYFRADYNQTEPALDHYTDLGDDMPEGKDRVGCVIICPGGAYTIRSYHEGEPVAQAFNKMGIKAFVLEYRLAPYKYPAILCDIQRAVRWVRYHADDFGIDPEKIAVLGFSAGGHLASMAVTLFDDGLENGDEIDRVSSRPDAGILAYPLISMEQPYTHRESRDNIIGGLENEAELEKKLTGYLNVTDKTPPVFLWHTGEDDGVAPENSLMMANALSKKKIPYEFHLYMCGGHGMGLGEGHKGNDTWSTLAGIWLHKLGF